MIAPIHITTTATMDAIAIAASTVATPSSAWARRLY